MDRDDIQRGLLITLWIAIVMLGLVCSVREYAGSQARAIREQFNCQVEYEGLKIQQYSQGRTGTIAPGTDN